MLVDFCILWTLLFKQISLLLDMLLRHFLGSPQFYLCVCTAYASGCILFLEVLLCQHTLPLKTTLTYCLQHTCNTYL